MEPPSDYRPAPTLGLRRLVRSLRNLTALGLLTLSFGVLALWVRSYFRSEVLEVIPEVNRKHLVISKAGSIQLACHRPLNLGSGSLSVQYDSRPTHFALEPYETRVSCTFYFQFDWMSNGIVACAPHWFVALVLATLAFALKPKPRLKFSVADLLILMSFSAALLAGVAGLSRLAS